VELDPTTQEIIDAERVRGRVFEGFEAALAKVQLAVRIEGNLPVRALPRLKPGESVVIHLLNRDYDPDADDVRPLRNVTVAFDPSATERHSVRSLPDLPAGARCTLFAPGAEPVELPVSDHRVTVPKLGLWAVLQWEARDR
jgi:hypothetical protein